MGLRETWKRFCQGLSLCVGGVLVSSGGDGILCRLLSSICQGNYNPSEEKTHSVFKNLQTVSEHTHLRNYSKKVPSILSVDWET